MSKQVIHGAVYCISHKGKVIAHGAMGRNNGLGLDAPMKPDTVYGIASITEFLKSLTDCVDFKDISVKELPMDMIITKIYSESLNPYV